MRTFTLWACLAAFACLLPDFAVFVSAVASSIVKQSFLEEGPGHCRDCGDVLSKEDEDEAKDGAPSAQLEEAESATTAEGKSSSGEDDDDDEEEGTKTTDNNTNGASATAAADNNNDNDPKDSTDKENADSSHSSPTSNEPVSRGDEPTDDTNTNEDVASRLNVLSQLSAVLPEDSTSPQQPDVVTTEAPGDAETVAEVTEEQQPKEEGEQKEQEEEPKDQVQKEEGPRDEERAQSIAEDDDDTASSGVVNAETASTQPEEKEQEEKPAEDEKEQEDKPTTADEDKEIIVDSPISEQTETEPTELQQALLNELSTTSSETTSSGGDEKDDDKDSVTSAVADEADQPSERPLSMKPLADALRPVEAAAAAALAPRSAALSPTETAEVASQPLSGEPQGDSSGEPTSSEERSAEPGSESEEGEHPTEGAAAAAAPTLPIAETVESTAVTVPVPEGASVASGGIRARRGRRDLRRFVRDASDDLAPGPCKDLVGDKFGWSESDTSVSRAAMVDLVEIMNELYNEELQPKAALKQIIQSLQSLKDWLEEGITIQQIRLLHSCYVDTAKQHNLLQAFIRFGLDSAMKANFMSASFSPHALRAKDASGNNLLHLAVQSGSSSTVQHVARDLLLGLPLEERMAIFEERNADNQTAVDVAAKTSPALHSTLKSTYGLLQRQVRRRRKS